VSALSQTSAKVYGDRHIDTAANARNDMNPKPEGRAPTQRNIAVIAHVREFLENHYADVPSLPELAAMAGMSRSHFSRTFHAVVGTPLRQYVGDLRLQRACALLRQSTLSLTAIAMECGFYDLPHLDKAFRRRFGMAPQRFRQPGAGGAGASAAAVMMSDPLPQRAASNTARARALVTEATWLVAQSRELERRIRRLHFRGGDTSDFEVDLRADRTRARVRSGEVSVPRTTTPIFGGPSEGATCDGCLDAIAPRAIEYEITVAADALHFHPECWRAWMAARTAPARDGGRAVA
jgi:AraC-like DNA-binding protein